MKASSLSKPIECGARGQSSFLLRTVPATLQTLISHKNWHSIGNQREVHYFLKFPPLVLYLLSGDMLAIHPWLLKRKDGCIGLSLKIVTCIHSFQSLVSKNFFHPNKCQLDTTGSLLWPPVATCLVRCRNLKSHECRTLCSVLSVPSLNLRQLFALNILFLPCIWSFQSAALMALGNLQCQQFINIASNSICQ